MLNFSQYIGGIMKTASNAFKIFFSLVIVLLFALQGYTKTITNSVNFSEPDIRDILVMILLMQMGMEYMTMMKTSQI